VQAALRLKDYTTIAPADHLPSRSAEIALERRAALLKRARFFSASAGRSWEELGGRTTFTRAALDAAQAGGSALQLQFPIESMAPVDRLIREYSTMVVPASTSAPSVIWHRYGMDPDPARRPGGDRRLLASLGD